MHSDSCGAATLGRHRLHHGFGKKPQGDKSACTAQAATPPASCRAFFFLRCEGSPARQENPSDTLVLAIAERGAAMRAQGEW